MPIIESKAEIISLKEESTCFRTFSLKLEKEIDYSAGEFVMVWLESSPETKRAYTISSYNEDKHFLSISVKLIETGKLTPKLFALKKKDKLMVKGPFGKTKYAGEKEISIIVGGCGVSLFFGLIDYFKKKGFPKETTLIYSAPSIEEIARKDEIRELEKEKKNNFKAYFTSPESKGKEKELAKYSCETVFIDKKFIQEKIPKPKEKTFYLCGSPGMVKAVTEALLELGVKQEKIKHERW